MRRQFCQTHTVRYDECDCYGLLTPAAFLCYMQDIAALDAEDAQLTGSGYWVVKRTLLSFAAPVRIHTTLELKTYGKSFSRITAQRGYEASMAGSQDAEPLISAHTLWVYVDARGRPIRLPERTAQIWLPDGPVPPQPEVPFPVFPESTPQRAAAVVRFSDIDLMSHMNNAAAVEMLDNAAWYGYTNYGITPDTAILIALHYDIEYLESARLGEELEIQTWFEPFPAAGQEFSRFQQITRGEKVVVRAFSRWLWNID